MFTTHPAVSRRAFLTQATCFGACYSLAATIPLRPLTAALLQDARVAQKPIADVGFASVRKVGDGLYATISDTSKGFTTLCNGGFLVGKDAALLIEGFATPAGASFQMDTLRKISDAPPAGALDTHYHFDHSFGNSFYGDHGIQLWGHAAVPKRMFESYTPLQAADRAAVLAPLEKKALEAKSPVEKQRAEGDLGAMSSVVDLSKKTALALPNRPLDPAKLPLNVDLGHMAVVVESYPGHSGTDLIVRVPEQKVVYSGDLIFNGMYPVCFDEKCTIAGWRNTLKTFSGYDKDTIFVPGHGQVCGQEAVTALRDVFDNISEQAETMYKAGVPVAEATQRYVIPEKYKNLGIFAWSFTIAPAITKLYGEWGAK